MSPMDKALTQARISAITLLLVPSGALAASASGAVDPLVATGVGLGLGAVVLGLLLRSLSNITGVQGRMDSAAANLARFDFDSSTGWAAFDSASKAAGREWEKRRGHAALLESVLDHAPLAVVLCDSADTVVLANRTARDLFSAGKNLNGQNFDAVLDGCPQEMKRAVKNQANVLFTVDPGEDRDEQAYHVSRPFFEIDLQRHTLYLITQLTRELGRQEVAIWKKVIRVLNHEFNNSLAPIASLVNSARMIVAKPELHHKLDPIFDTIAERTTHLQTFLESYARFARLGPPNKVEVRWSELLEKVSNVTGCTVSGEPPQPTGRIDASQFQQALINLVKNATDAGSPPEQTVIELGAAADGGVRISVLDRGQGMTDEVMRQALVPFYSTKKEGTGLGLALVREIVEGHDGSIVLAHREGGGVAVNISIPRAS